VINILSGQQEGGDVETPGDEQPLDLSAAQVGDVLAGLYGLRPDRIDPVEGELATICRVEAAGRVLAVKVSRDAGGERAVAAWRTGVMSQLATSGAPVPGVLLDRAGSPVSTADVDGVPVLVVVEQWLAGSPLYAVDVDEALLRDVGGTAARLAAALASAPAPPAPLTHVWEASRGRTTILAALPDVGDAETRAGVVRAADGFARDVQPHLAALPRAVVHQDLHDANLLVGSADGRRRIVGVLDFGDMLAGLRIAELAVAAGYAARLTPDPLDGFLAVVAGWGPAVPLTDAEVAVLLPLARTRLAVNAAVWAARSSGPRASYAAARSARSLPALRGLLDADPGAVADEVRRRTRA
jgi:Ser/Thr protein kinase RdoA (MazF antagonist)